MCNGHATVVHGSVYFGAGNTTDIALKYIVYCYDPSQDNWTTLPPLPVWSFSLGHIDGKLVAVGGIRNSDNKVTSEVYTYVERSHKWKQTFPPMPTARRSVQVLSLQSALLAVGGDIQGDLVTDAVEILKLDSLQWYKADRIPIACNCISLVAVGNICYALGGALGYESTAAFLNQALYASVDDLLCNAVPANLKETTHITGCSSDTQSAWKTLPNTPTYIPAAAVLADNLLAIGGARGDQADGGDDMREVYLYSTAANSWIYISDLPAPRANTAVVAL